MKSHISVILLALATLSSCCLLSLFGVGPLENGTAAPDFTLTSLEGADVSLSNYAGRPVLLNFWSPS